MAILSVAKTETALTRAGRIVAWIRGAAARLIRAVKASTPYQWLDTHVFDAPPVKYTTLIGYCVVLGVTLTILFGASILVIRKHDAAAVDNRIANAKREIARSQADAADHIATQTMELERMRNELSACYASLTPVVPQLTPRNTRRGARTSQQKPATPGYNGPRPW